MYLVQPGLFVGLLGDILTFVGAILLAWDAVQRERDFRKMRQVAKVLGSPWMARLRVEMEGLIVTDEKDVEQAFIRRSSRKAKYGCFLLAIGFALLVAARAIGMSI